MSIELFFTKSEANSFQSLPCFKAWVYIYIYIMLILCLLYVYIYLCNIKLFKKFNLEILFWIHMRFVKWIIKYFILIFNQLFMNKIWFFRLWNVCHCFRYGTQSTYIRIKRIHYKLNWFTFIIKLISLNFDFKLKINVYNTSLYCR